MRKESAPLAAPGEREETAQQMHRKAARWPSSRAHVSWMLGRVWWGSLLGASTGLMVLYILLTSHGPTDYCQDYLAAVRLLHGQPIYQPLHCWKGTIYVPTPLEYDTHPPFAALTLLPLGWLPLVSASMVWGLCCFAAYSLSGVLLLRTLGWASLRNLALFMVGSLLWTPSVGAEEYQNFGQVLTLLLVGAWLLERRRSTGWSGTLLGLASLLKIWPLVLFGGAVLQRRWRLTWVGGAVVALGTALTVIVVGAGAYGAYLGPVRANELGWLPSSGNLSVVGVVTRVLVGYPAPAQFAVPLIPGVAPTTAALLGEGVAAVLLGATLLFLWWCARQAQDGPVAELCQSLLLTILLLVFPLSWYTGLITLLLPGTQLILALRQLPRPPRWWYVLVGASLLPLLSPDRLVLAVPVWFAGPTEAVLPKIGTIVAGLPTYGLLLFAFAQAYLLWRAARDGASAAGAARGEGAGTLAAK